MSLFFAKTPGGERFYMNRAELRYSTSNSLFSHIDRQNINMYLKAEDLTLFPTPVGKSFVCGNETVISLTDDSNQSGQSAKLYLRDIHLQAFMFRKKQEWGPVSQCSLTGSYRDESAPLYTGLTLLFGVVVTVGGYAAWRYYKVKDTQYGTMA